MSRFILLEAAPWNVSDGSAATVHLAGGGRYPYSGLRGFTDWRAGLAEFPYFVAEAGFSEGKWNGGVLPPTSRIRIFPSDAALRDTLLTQYHWKGAPIALRSGDDDVSTTTFVLELTGTVDSVTESDGSILLTVSDYSSKLSRPVVDARFAGTGSIEGPAEAEGRAKRLTFGFVYNVEGFLLDKPNNIYEFGDPARVFTSFSSVKDMGRAASPAPTTVTWQGSIAATLTALQASTPAQGSCVVAPSIACVKWWTKPAGPLTADIQVDVAGGSNKVSDVAARLLSVTGIGVSINSADLAAINTARTYDVGLHIGDDNETIAQALDRLLIPCNVLWTLNPDGTIRLGEFQFSTASESLGVIDVERVETFKPLNQVTLGYKRNHRKHTDGEISAAILASDVDDFGAASQNYVAPGDSNRVRFSKFEQGTLGWALLYNPVPLAGITISAAIDAPTAKPYAVINGSFTTSGQTVSIGSTGVSDPAFRFPVTAGERIFVRAQLSSGGPIGSWTFAVGFLNAAGGVVSQVVISTGAASLGFPSSQAAFVTVPAGAVGAWMEHYVGSSGAGAFYAVISEPMVSGAAVNQTAFPAFNPGPSSELGADVTAAVVGPAASEVYYDNAGTTFQSAEDMTFVVKSSFGTAVSGVAMKYRVNSGTFNSFDAGSGWQTMTVTSGGATITPTSLTTDTAELEISATFFGRTLPSYTVKVTKVLAPPAPTGTGGGGSGSTDVASQTSGFLAINTASFTDIIQSGGLKFTLPTGKTTLRVVVNLQCKYGASANQNGPWGVEFKVQRGGVDQGSVQHSDPDNEIFDIETPAGATRRISSGGTMQYTLDMSGLSAGTQYTVNLPTRVASGTLPTNGVNMSFTGSVVLSAP